MARPSRQQPVMTPTDIIVAHTGCTAAQAEAALSALVEAGWQAPAGAVAAASPTATSDDIAPTDVVALDPNAPLTAHTDGACSGNPGPGGWAVVFSQDNVVVSEHCGYDPGPTKNNRMELRAIREAIERTPVDQPLVINWLAGEGVQAE